MSICNGAVGASRVTGFHVDDPHTPATSLTGGWADGERWWAVVPGVGEALIVGRSPYPSAFLTADGALEPIVLPSAWHADPLTGGVLDAQRRVWSWDRSVAPAGGLVRVDLQTGDVLRLAMPQDWPLPRSAPETRIAFASERVISFRYRGMYQYYDAMYDVQSGEWTALQPVAAPRGLSFAWLSLPLSSGLRVGELRFDGRLADSENEESLAVVVEPDGRWWLADGGCDLSEYSRDARALIDGSPLIWGDRPWRIDVAAVRGDMPAGEPMQWWIGEVVLGERWTLEDIDEGDAWFGG